MPNKKTASKAAQTLGRLGKGSPKGISPEERERRRIAASTLSARMVAEGRHPRVGKGISASHQAKLQAGKMAKMAAKKKQDTNENT